SLTKTNYITILPPLVSNFDADTTLALPNEPIQFTDLSSGGPETWKWDFGNGQFSTTQNPIFAYNIPGVYSVELLVKSGWRADSLTKTNYITVVEPLTAAFEADKTFALIGESIHFTDLSQGNPGSWFWDFGNGESSILQNPDIQYNSPGLYTIKLIVANDWFSDTLIIENYITVVEPLIANFIVSKTFAFTGDAIQFTDLSQGNPEIWQWDFGNGQTSSLQNPVYTYTTPGVYTIKLVVTNDWLTDSLVKENYITVVQTLVANFKADTAFAWLGHTTQFTDLSSGNPTSWWWNFGDQISSQVQDPVHVYTHEGTYTVVLAVTNQYQSDYEFKINYITVREPLNAQFKADTTKVLTGQNIRFTNLSTGFPTSRIWDFGDNTVSQVLNPVYHYLQPGYYTVSLQVFENDSTDSEVKENFIWVRDTLEADFYAEPLVIHAGETVHFYDDSRGSPNQWKWFFGEGKSSNLQNPVYKYNNPGIFTVRLMVSDPFDSDTLIRENYITVLTPIHSQIVSLPQGWSGISTYLLPLSPGLPDIFQNVAGSLVFAMNNIGIYWPSQNINTIGDWNPLDGLIVKMTDESQVEVNGDINPINKIELSEGWNILPVISPCSQSSNSVFGALGDTLVIVKEIAGVDVFWPEAGISTLEYVNSGKSYYILVTQEVSVQFQACGEKFLPVTANQNDSYFNPWNDFQKTSLSHTIAIDRNAFVESTLNKTRVENGDLIGVFNKNGLCSGIINVIHTGNDGKLEKPLALTAFGKDQMITEIPGFEPGEQMSFGLSRQKTGEFIEISASFDDKFPDMDLFGVNGLSGISSFTIQNTSSEDSGIFIYPNPGEGLFRIEIRKITSIIHLEVLSAEGR
ncbi:MAG: PKD domain-containing protein, partial [Bacteroidales bacterium]